MDNKILSISKVESINNVPMEYLLSQHQHGYHQTNECQIIYVIQLCVYKYTFYPLVLILHSMFIITSYYQQSRCDNVAAFSK